MAPGNVAIADLDMYHGQVSTHLDIYARSSTAALAREEHFDAADEIFREAGRPHSSGLVVFGGPYRPDDATDITPEQLIRLLEGMRGIYGTVVVDAGNTLDTRALAVLERADVVVLVLTPDIPSLRLIHASLQVLSESGTATDRAVFVVNHIYPKAMIGGEQIEEHLGIKVGVQIPYDGESFLKSVNEGQPLVTFAHRSAAGVALRKLCRRAHQHRSRQDRYRAASAARTLQGSARPRLTCPGHAGLSVQRLEPEDVAPAQGCLLILAIAVDVDAHGQSTVPVLADVAEAVGVANLVGHQRFHHQLVLTAGQ